MKPGDLGMYDPAYVDRHAPWLRRVLHTWFRARVEGLARLPEGPFVAVGNHSGGVMIPDTLVWLAAYHTAGRAVPLLALAHDVAFSSFPRPLSLALARLGAIRADRALAREALARGYAVQIYPGGDHDACRSVLERNRIVFAGRTGYAELARDADVPIVPVVSIGGHETMLVLDSGARFVHRIGFLRRRRLTTCPITVSVPWGLWVGPTPGHLPLPSRIVVRVLDPIPTRGQTVAELDAFVRSRLQSALDELAAQRRFPLWG
jgi:1-acyl-sn-glycerol-3-phosphate acyltransferase